MEDIHLINDKLSPPDCIREFLRTIYGINKRSRLRKLGNYYSIHDFILENGREFTPQTLPLKYKPLRPKHCFENAFNLMTFESNLTYVEGFAMGVIPTHHAWCCDLHGNVRDNTWTGDGEDCAVPGVAYFGVPFKRRVVLDVVMDCKRHGVIDQWEADWPILRGKYPDFLQEIQK